MLYRIAHHIIAINCTIGGVVIPDHGIPPQISYPKLAPRLWVSINRMKFSQCIVDEIIVVNVSVRRRGLNERMLSVRRDGYGVDFRINGKWHSKADVTVEVDEQKIITSV